ncbi:SET domain-containing protein 5 [Lachnellula arida]|uniref:SET domain-containing protein 5 n=1 Tax=Lachnellula arida TaxID=1316785 RepID=A0A8T9BKD9_9HELO|nr:SET domain-containing protein 5 [Lachnellula arida]
MDRVLSTRDREVFLRIAIDQLPSASREAYLSLSTIYGNPTVIAQDVLKANNFEIQVRGEIHLAVFPETSRMNHDCAPNSQYCLDPARLTHYVHAACSISANEEITISYTSPLQPYADRRSYLQNAFHFTCICARCKSGKRSDAVLTQIDSLQETLVDWWPGSTATIETADKLVRLYEEQALHGFLDSGYGLAALTYNSFGDTEAAKKYARLAAEIVAMKDGPGVAAYESWDSVAKDPEGHWSWRTRVFR